MNKTTIIGLVVGVALVGGLLWYSQYKGAMNSDPMNQDQGMEQTVPAGSGIEDGPAGAGKVAGYTLEDIAMHNGEESCWTAVSGNVYDVTTWIPQHPGGPQRILAMCGKDATAAFEGQHGGMPRPEEMLASFKIGVLQ
jgi:cytochrome b involved in lipid metabolism